MGLPRPSYERVRVLVHVARRLRRQSGPRVSTLAVDVAFRVRPPVALIRPLFTPPAPRLRDRAPPK
jgi:hypothetical protein